MSNHCFFKVPNLYHSYCIQKAYSIDIILISLAHKTYNYCAVMSTNLCNQTSADEKLMKYMYISHLVTTYSTNLLIFIFTCIFTLSLRLVSVLLMFSF